MKKIFLLLSALFLVTGISELSAQNTTTKKSTTNYKKNPLIYGPKSAAKIKDLFFTRTGFKLPQTISSINGIAGYTDFEPIEGAGNIYTWDFTNGFQISAISKSEGTAGANDKISLVSFNYGGLNTLELGNTISLNKSTLSSIQKLYPNKLTKFKNSKTPTYKINTGSVYATFYFNEKSILTSLSISTYDLEI
ncbi:MAG: hypothetical protein LBQ84_06135 [Flavobacteriaceae bacterium]|jgi:hypothetical protein|nr:hypothetical protein [Flavobacteriaceae bacterium]